MPCYDKIKIKVKRKFFRKEADLEVRAKFGVLVDQLPEDWGYDETINLRFDKEKNAYVMRIPHLSYNPEGYPCIEKPSKEEFVYKGNFKDVLSKAKKDLRENIEKMVEGAVSRALDIAYS